MYVLNINIILFNYIAKQNIYPKHGASRQFSTRGLCNLLSSRVCATFIALSFLLKPSFKHSINVSVCAKRSKHCIEK